MTMFHKIYVSSSEKKILELRTVANLHLDFLFTYTRIYLSISLFWDEFLCSTYLTTSFLFDFVISAIISMCPNTLEFVPFLVPWSVMSLWLCGLFYVLHYWGISSCNYLCHGTILWEEWSCNFLIFYILIIILFECYDSPLKWYIKVSCSSLLKNIVSYEIVVISVLSVWGYSSWR